MRAHIHAVSHRLFKSLLLLAILLVAALMPGEARSAFARNGPQALPEAAGSSFNSSFNGSHGGWSVVYGPWKQGASSYTTRGLDSVVSSIKHSGTYLNFVYSAKLKRSSSDSLDAQQGLFVRGQSVPLGNKQMWSSGWYFFYETDQEVTIGELGAGASYNQTNVLVDASGWNVLKVVAYDDILAFYLNGTQIHHTHDVSFAPGSVGIWMYDPPGSTSNNLSVDFAKLTVMP